MFAYQDLFPSPRLRLASSDPCSCVADTNAHSAEHLHHRAIRGLSTAMHLLFLKCNCRFLATMARCWVLSPTLLAHIARCLLLSKLHRGHSPTPRHSQSLVSMLSAHQKTTAVKAAAAQLLPPTLLQMAARVCSKLMLLQMQVQMQLLCRPAQLLVQMCVLQASVMRVQPWLTARRAQKLSPPPSMMILMQILSSRRAQVFS